MLSVCKFLVRASGVLVAVVGLTGCYDLSDPDGPRREDFFRDQHANAQEQQQGQTAVAPSHEGRAAINLDDDVVALLAQHQPQPQPASAAARKLHMSAENRD